MPALTMYNLKRKEPIMRTPHMKMTDLYLFTELRINGKIIPFISHTPFFPDGCDGCGKYKGEDYETQGIYLEFFDDKFLCDECLCENGARAITRGMYIRIINLN
jgi:hypothetical protein